MSENILTQIRAQYEFFTRVEKRIADLILDDPQKFVTYPTAKVAKLCNVSQGSINNFARKLTPDGFSFLKLEIARCVSLSQDIQTEPVKQSDGNYLKAMERKIRQDISALCNTLEINNDEAIKQAINLIAGAKRVELMGVSRSGLVAKTLNFNLIKLGICSSFVGDSTMFEVCATTLSKEDIVIAISSSGTTKEVVDAVGIAKRIGANVIGITSNKFSPLAKLSDAILLTTAGHGKTDGIQDRIRMSQLLIIDTLCGYIEYLNKKQSNKGE